MTTNPSRKTIILVVFPLLLHLVFMDPGFAQKPLVFTQQFTELLEKNDLIYEQPVETWFRIQPFEKRLSDYDMVVRTFEGDLEIRHIIRIHPENEPPQVHAPLLLNHMATNQESEDILVARMGTKELKTFGADWGMYSDFIPKKGLTEYSHARLISIHKKGGPMVHTLLLRNTPFKDMGTGDICIIRFNYDRLKEN